MTTSPIPDHRLGVNAVPHLFGWCLSSMHTLCHHAYTTAAGVPRVCVCDCHGGAR